MPNIPITERSLRNLRSLPNHAGLSGAELLQGELVDGTAVIVKRSHEKASTIQKLLGHRVNLEYQLWADGTLDQLPSDVSSAVLAAWIEGKVATVVMQDLGDGILGREHQFTQQEAIRMLRRLDELHRSGIRPMATTSLYNLVNTFSLTRVQSLVPAAPILRDISRGWAAFEHLAPPSIAQKVLEIVRHPDALVAALARCSPSFCHGDVAPANMAWQGNQLVLIDWEQAFVGPAALDIARFLPSGLRFSEINNDWFLEQYTIVAGDRFDGVALRLSLLATLVWYGWKKAIDATEDPSLAVRLVEAENLKWWCEQAVEGLRVLCRCKFR
jgi:thiamine kinase-like enzyme